MLRLNLDHLQLKDEAMRNISLASENFHRIRELRLKGNFLFERDTLFELKGLKLELLDLSEVLIWDKFHLLCDLNTEFLTEVILSQCGIQE